MKEIPSFSAFAAYAFQENGKMLGTLLAEDLILRQDKKSKALRRTFHSFFKSQVSDYSNLVARAIEAAILDNAGYSGAVYTLVAYIKTLYLREVNDFVNSIKHRIELEKSDAVGFFNLTYLSDLVDMLSYIDIAHVDTDGTKLETVVPMPSWPLKELVRLRTLGHWYDPDKHIELFWEPLDPHSEDTKALSDEIKALSDAQYSTELKTL